MTKSEYLSLVQTSLEKSMPSITNNFKKSLEKISNEHGSFDLTSTDFI